MLRTQGEGGLDISARSGSLRNMQRPSTARSPREGAFVERPVDTCLPGGSEERIKYRISRRSSHGQRRPWYGTSVGH